MKKILAAIMFALLMMHSAFAQQVWTVQTVPNTRIQSNTIHVSDPDGYLSQSAENAINTVLGSVRDTVDVFIVTLSSIGYEAPKMFASSLFNDWGIGDKSKNNGLLLLFVEDQHALEFETGYGIEAVLPDIECYRIFNKIIVPYFKQGDYQGGLCAGVCEIVRDFGGTIPEGIMDNLDYEKRDTQIDESAKPKEETSWWEEILNFVFVFFVVIVPFVSFVSYVSNKKDKKKKDEKEVFPMYYSVDENNELKLIETGENGWTGDVWKDKRRSKMTNFGCAPLIIYLAIFMIFGYLQKDTDSRAVINAITILTVVTYLTWICLRQNIRVIMESNRIAKDAISPKDVYRIAKNNTRTKAFNYLAYWIGWLFIKNYDKKIVKSENGRCAVCGEVLEETNDFTFTEAQNFEINKDILKYTAMRCPSGHTYIIKNKGSQYDSYSECTQCHARATKKTKTKVIKKPTTSQTGLDEVTYDCAFCSATFTKNIETPKIAPSGGDYSGGGSGYSSGYSSSSSSSGSFGGGSSGGGGYSGRW